MVARLALIYFLVQGILGVFIFIMNKEQKLSLTVEEILLFWGAFFIFNSVFFSNPTLWNFFKENLKKAKSYKSLLIPIAAGFIMMYLFYLLRYISFLIHGMSEFINVDLLISKLPVLSLERLVFTGFFPAYNEEFLFRFLLYFIVFNILLSGSEKTNKTSIGIGINLGDRVSVIVDKLDNLLPYTKETRWAVVSSLVFTFSHSPQMGDFYVYFFGGLVFSTLFLRYGFISSVICHAFSNCISPFAAILAAKSLSFIIS